MTDQKLRGYWIIHPTGNWDPTCLTANANGNAVSTKFNIANSATVQRWLILTMEQARALETTSSIEEIKAGDTVKQNVRHGIYTLDGRKVAADEQQLKSLPKGIYIVGTKKIVVGK